jgi:hypothetical protein
VAGEGTAGVDAADVVAPVVGSVVPLPPQAAMNKGIK